MAIPPGEVKQRARARSTVQACIAAGKIVREPCEVCGDTNTEAHHEDYTKPLDVHWLCSGHHRALHRIRPLANTYSEAVTILQEKHTVNLPAKDSKAKRGFNDSIKEIRQIVKARTIAGTVCVTLPKSLRDPLGIDNGDRLMISIDSANRCLVVTKEKE